MGEVVKLPGTMDAPDECLDAMKGNLESCIILGRDHDGIETFSVTRMDLSEFVYLLERAKFAYMLAMTEGE